jgi:general secretion pathway protein D
LKQLAEEKVRKEEQRKLEAEKVAQEKQRIQEARAQQLAQEKAQREQAQKAKEEEQARLKAEKEAQLKAEQERLAQEKEARLKQLSIEKTKREEQRKLEEERRVQERQQELARRQEELQTKLRASMKAVAEEKAITEAALKKQREDKAKIEKIEKLWQRARKLYAQGLYEEAIRDFQKIIELEGNPRIKYTPEAKKYIKEARDQIIKKERVDSSQEVELIERDMINEVLKQQTPPYIEPPPRTEEVKEVTLVEPPLIRKKLKKTVTLDFDKVSLESVLVFLSQETEVNLVASQKVVEAGFKVTARFQQTALEEAIKYITKSLGLIYRIDKEVIWIANPEEIATEPLETRVYYLSKGGGLFTEFSPMTSGSSETGLGGSSAQITKISTIEDTLKEIVPWPADSKLVYDKRINALLIRNTPQNLQMLEDLLYNLDVTPCQVLIEARFLEVDVTDIRELGLEWKLAGGDFALKERDGVYKKGIAKDSGLDFSSFTRATEGLNLTYKGMLTNSQLQVVLHALDETKKLKTLSSPRITTLNNQMASIKVVDEWIYPTRYEFEIVQFDLNGDGDYSDANETVYQNVPKDFLRRDVGILLKVIPSVGADRKTINLSLIPEVSEATADAFVYTGDVKLPKFTSRNLSTTVVANSGDTVVLGGMIKESRTKTVTKVPFLGDIPLLGAFFKKDADSIQRKNLLIFVTAKILSPSGEEIIVAQK